MVKAPSDFPALHAQAQERAAPYWPPGVSRTLQAPDRTVWEQFEARALRGGEALALGFLGRFWSWTQLLQETRALAGGLQRLGVAPGDRVLLFTQNSPPYVMAFHALLCIGAVVVPINPMNKAIELEHYIRDAGATLAITSSDIAAEMAAAAQQTGGLLHQLVVFDLADALAPDADDSSWPVAWRDWLHARHLRPQVPGLALHEWSELMARQEEPRPARARPDDLAILPYTSGTTGVAKGCMHTHRTLLHNAQAAGPWMDMREGDRVLIAVPMFHITGLVMGMLASVAHGCRMEVMPRWDRRLAAQTIAQERITHWPNIPTMVMDLLGADDLDLGGLAGLRYIGGGGAQMPDAVAQRLEELTGLRYVEGYGLTETAAPTHLNPMQAPRSHCLGIPFVGTCAAVVDPDTLQAVPVGEVGEIVVSGPQLFLGYWQRPRDTANAFFERDGRRWFRTGDLGRMDAEGYFHIADRLKRMINASGFKVWPAEVEALLHRHPAVREACVIATRDPYRGESVKAVIVLREGLAGQTSAQDIIDWSREHMAAYKYPRVIEFVDELPRTASGKVLWRRLQERQDAHDVERQDDAER